MWEDMISSAFQVKKDHHNGTKRVSSDPLFRHIKYVWNTESERDSGNELDSAGACPVNRWHYYVYVCGDKGLIQVFSASGMFLPLPTSKKTA